LRGPDDQDDLEESLDNASEVTIADSAALQLRSASRPRCSTTPQRLSVFLVHGRSCPVSGPVAPWPMCGRLRVAKSFLDGGRLLRMTRVAAGHEQDRPRVHRSVGMGTGEGPARAQYNWVRRERRAMGSREFRPCSWVDSPGPRTDGFHRRARPARLRDRRLIQPGRSRAGWMLGISTEELVRPFLRIEQQNRPLERRFQRR
jgi:hypothetical protein